MFEVLNITGPIFGLTALGYLLARLKALGPQDIATLGKYVVMIGMPAILFRAASNPAILSDLNWAYMGTYALTLATIGLALWLLARHRSAPRRAIMTLGAMSPNSGFIGYALIGLALPGMQDLIIAMNTVVEMTLIIPAGLALLEASKSDGPRAGQLARQIVLSLVKRPLVLAFPLGLAVALSGVPMPVAASRALDLLAATTPALAMIFLGGALAGLAAKGTWGDSFLVTLARLCAAPALGFGLLIWLEPGLDPTLTTALILSTAMPMIGIYPMLAADVGQAAFGARTLLAATVLGFFTLSGLIAVL